MVLQRKPVTRWRVTSRTPWPARPSATTRAARPPRPRGPPRTPSSRASRPGQSQRSGAKGEGAPRRGAGLLALALLGAMSLPFLGDGIFVLIAAELDACMLGRLGCATQRFWRASVPDPAHKGSALPEILV